MAGFFSSLKISASGLIAQRARVEAASSNLANAETTRGPDGRAYRRIDPVFESIEEGEGSAVRVAAMHRSDRVRRIFNPDHPDADAEGFVELPDVNPIHEIVNLMSARRSYEANATAFDTLKAMAARAIEILG
ncbi:MAG: flagellar basal body rod protein FlgC [Deltaproteobacteria bacterium]|nr:MAG: flagellar basal body rod protein FlgC [Deltaproteobacteria bacterium]